MRVRPALRLPSRTFGTTARTSIDGLTNMMRVRDVALGRFGENNIREGAPLATLEDVLVPLYMGHRYQVEAVTKLDWRRGLYLQPAWQGRSQPADHSTG